MTTTARSGSRTRALVEPRRRRRIEWVALRWQARLDGEWADRVVPWVTAVVLFLVWAGIALARADRLDAGAVLGRHVQALWGLAGGNAPEVTIGREGNLFADHLPVVLVPLGALARILSPGAVLVTAQSAALALGVVPLWHLARRVAGLGVGATGALALAYALHPAVADLAVADFHPTTLALPALLAMAYFVEQEQWRRVTVAAVLAMVCSSELGLVVAALGVVLVVERRRRIGLRLVVLGLGWTLVALLAIQAPLGTTGLVAPEAFGGYGEGALDVLVEMVRNPFRPLGALFVEDQVRLVGLTLGPLLFLPLVGARRLLPALPLQALYLVADVPVTGPTGGGRMVPLVAFGFVAATFALARLGRIRLERVLVDRRILGLLLAASASAWLTTSPLSPYEQPWRSDRPSEADLRVALARLPALVPVRVPAALAPEVAERSSVFVLEDLVRVADDGSVREPAPGSLIEGVRALVVDTSVFELDESGAERLRIGLRRLGFLQIRASGDIRVFLPFVVTPDRRDVTTPPVTVPTTLPPPSEGPVPVELPPVETTTGPG